MQDKYPFFKYVPGESKVHLMNSKKKIAWFLLSLLAMLALRTYGALLIMSLYLLVIMSLTEIKLEAYIKNTVIIWPLYVAITFATLLVSFDGLFSVFIAIKSLLIILLFLILTFTTSLSEIAWGLEGLLEFLKRFRVPVSRISLKIALGIKFVATLFEQFKTVRKSMAYRGVPYHGGMCKTFKNMFFPVFRLSYKLSSRMGAAMKLRFYGVSKQRTNYHENKVTRFDKVLLVSSLLMVYISMVWGWIS